MDLVRGNMHTIMYGCRYTSIPLVYACRDKYNGLRSGQNNLCSKLNATDKISRGFSLLLCMQEGQSYKLFEGLVHVPLVLDRANSEQHKHNVCEWIMQRHQ